MQGFPGIIVERVALYTSYGFTPTGVYTSIPNAPALSVAVQNYGRSTAGRVRIFFKIKCPPEEEVENVFHKLTQKMRDWVNARRTVYKRGSLQTWLENSGYSDGKSCHVSFGPKFSLILSKDCIMTRINSWYASMSSFLRLDFTCWMTIVSERRNSFWL